MISDYYFGLSEKCFLFGWGMNFGLPLKKTGDLNSKLSDELKKRSMLVSLTISVSPIINNIIQFTSTVIKSNPNLVRFKHVSQHFFTAKYISTQQTFYLLKATMQFCECWQSHISL
jgi:uncharacterized membrane protein